MIDNWVKTFLLIIHFLAHLLKNGSSKFSNYYYTPSHLFKEILRKKLIFYTYLNDDVISSKFTQSSMWF